MIRKYIGSAEVIHGRAEYYWLLQENTTPGKRKVYISYVENDGYIAGESWENAYIYSPTSLIFTEKETYVYATEDDEYPQTLNVTVNANDLYYLNRVTEGEIQFQYQLLKDNAPTDIGEPVPLDEEGTASFTYTIPNRKGEDIYLFAVYIPSGNHAKAVTTEALIVHIKRELNINLTPIIIRPNDTVPINIQITDENDSLIDKGTLKLYLDDELIHTVENTDFNNYTYTHTFSDSLSGGEHILTATFEDNAIYENTTNTTTVYIREESRIALDEYTWGNQASVNENNDVTYGTAIINASVYNPNDEPITEGTVTLDILDYQETLSLNEEGKVSFTYYINDTYSADDEIPYIITFNETDKYLTSTDNSKIIIRTKIIVNMEPVELLAGQSNTLTATVKDEFDNNVDRGQISFEIETADD